ncbi:alpha/beta hydrolase [Ferrimonas balearica]|uniref:alpha/beta hydrolase n=1 Tax=Ferrimonas balearica TaxID=44012 RepID=UPI001F2767B5|nr:alpha/beta hydrolase [Ferrimonas balearica]MBY6018920.1 alpha/beta hydrolase [Halomonas denitrificans]MBY6096110.1 alpha/beta hydrolase [Ferrimonas balearica]
MPSWRALALNKLLYRAMRSRFARCNDVHALRATISGLDKLGNYILPPSGLDSVADQLGGVPCDWVLTGRSVSEKVILYFHGGGFCLRSPGVHGALLGRLAEATNARGLMVDYRLAPEFPYPAAVNDCLSVYQTLLEQGMVPGQLILAGDSAGGNLVLTTMMQAREQGLPQPAAAILLSPATDMALNGESAFLLREQDPFFDLGALLLMRNCYLNGHMPCDPLVSPCYGDLHDLAPMMIHVGALEMLQDDSVRLAAQVRRHGGVVDLTIWPGLAHVFPLFYQLPEAREAISRIADFIVHHTDHAALGPD